MLFVAPVEKLIFARTLRIVLGAGLLAGLVGSKSAYGDEPEAFAAKAITSVNRGPFFMEGQNYVQKTASLGQDDECVPVAVDQDRQVDIMFLHCSDQAIKSDGEAEELTSNFSIPESLARRVHFWRRIYSMWSTEDFVLHSAEFPEVIMEVGRYAASAPEATRVKMAKKVLRDRQRHYRTLLMTMHANRNAGSFAFDPIMNRIARSMAHIQNPNKYKMVAQSLRVQRGQKEYIGKGIESASRYLPHIETEFLKRGLPPELSRIAFVESSFNLKAVSKVGASGVYQFMRFTAKEYLTLNNYIDERRDPIKAGVAAAKLLQTNYKILGNWPLAITAYNHGAYSLKRAVAKLGSNDLPYLINRYDNASFGFASKNFYCEFLGILSTLENKSKYFPDVKEDKPLVFQEYRLPRGLSIAYLRKKFNLSVDDILSLNPDIDRRHVLRGGHLPRGYVLKLPGDNDGDKTAEVEINPS